MYALARPIRYALVGCGLALGAPMGLFALRSVQTQSLPTAGWIASQVRSDPLLYGYVTFATAMVLTTVGVILSRSVDSLEALSDTDDLTRLANRRHFDTALIREMARARRDGTPLSLMVLDVDYFKRVNDRHGHAVGDAALQRVARVLRGASRTMDLAARHGGDEFALLLPNTSLEQARSIAQRFSLMLRNAPPYAAGAPPITCSIGIASAEARDDAEGVSLRARADRALYSAKEGGRDRTVAHSLESEPPAREGLPLART